MSRVDADTIERAVRGCYRIDKMQLLQDAWQRSAEIRPPAAKLLLFFLFVIIPALFAISFLLPETRLTHAAAQQRAPWLNLLIDLLRGSASLPLLAPWLAMLLELGINVARDSNKTPRSLFDAYACALPLSIAALAWWWALSIGMQLYVLPGIYLLVACWLALPLIFDAGLKPLAALRVSITAIHHRWFDVAAIVIFSLIMITLSALLVVPLFWTLPWFAAITGMLYRRIFRTEVTAQS